MIKKSRFFCLILSVLLFTQLSGCVSKNISLYENFNVDRSFAAKAIGIPENEVTEDDIVSIKDLLITIGFDAIHSKNTAGFYMKDFIPGKTGINEIEKLINTEILKPAYSGKADEITYANNIGRFRVHHKNGIIKNVSFMIVASSSYHGTRYFGYRELCENTFSNIIKTLGYKFKLRYEDGDEVYDNGRFWCFCGLEDDYHYSIYFTTNY